MKYYGHLPFQNEGTDLEIAGYLNFAKAEIRKECDELKTSDRGFQTMLCHIEIMIMFADHSDAFDSDVSLSLDGEDIDGWQSTFEDWFVRCGSKIPKKYRDGFKENADKLFARLREI